MALARVQKRRGRVEGISLFGRHWPAGSALVVSCLVLSYASVSIGEDGWQWRTDKIDDGRRLLAFTEFDAGDHFSGLSYYCKPSSGRIEVRGSTDKQQRQVFADLIRADSYPTLKLEGEESVWELSHSDDDGWEFHFEITADGAAFDKFKKTGQFAFKVGGLVVDNGIRKAGLDKVSEFQAVCRKLPADKVPDRPKAQQLFPETHATPVPWMVKP
jgi:hypothetical protein